MGRPVASHRLGKYRFCDISTRGKPKAIKQGTLGEAYNVEDVCSDRQLAVQRVPLGILSESQRRCLQHYLQNIIMQHYDMRFPHIEQLRDVFLTDEHLNIVLDRADGGTLEQLEQRARGRVGRAGLTLSDIRWFFQQLILTLDYLHQKQPGVIQDIRIQDLLLLRVTGLDRRLLKVSLLEEDRLTGRLHDTHSTNPYTSPEQVDEGQDLDAAKVDIWKAGVILYTLACGSPPLTYEWCGSIPLRELRGFPPELSQLLQAMLAFEPSARIDVEGIKQQAWFVRQIPPNALSMVDKLLKADSPCRRDRGDVQDTVDEVLRMLAAVDTGSDCDLEQVLGIDVENMISVLNSEWPMAQ